MRSVRSQKELLRRIDNAKSMLDKKMEDYINGYLAWNIPLPDKITIVLKQCIKSKYDYIALYKDKILYGRPISLNMTADDLSKFGNGGITVVQDGILVTRAEDINKYIVKVDVDFNLLCPFFNGLLEDSITGNYKEIILPTFIKDLQSGSMRGCRCSESIKIPTHLLIQTAKSGLFIEDGCQPTLIRTGSFGLNYLTKETIGKGIYKYNNVLEMGRGIVVYPEKLRIAEERGNEYDYISGFNYKNFFSSPDELIISLLLFKYKIVCVSDVVAALYDIYYEKILSI